MAADANKRQHLEEALERFVTFGTLMDVHTRRYLVAWMRARFSDAPLPESLNSAYFHYFQKGLDKLFANETLMQLGRRHEVFSLQIIRDVLEWFRRTFEREAAKHPFGDERIAIEGWSIRPLKHFAESWPALFRQIGLYYTRDEFPTAFYESRFRELFPGGRLSDNPENVASAEFLFTDVLSQWDALLQTKILEWQLHHFQETFTDFAADLHRKVQQFQTFTSLLMPFSDYLDRYWDLGTPLYRDGDLDVLRHYDEVLQQEDNIRKLADLLGRLRKAEIEADEETYERTFIRRKRIEDPDVPAAVTGVKPWNSIRHALASEWALFAEEQTTSLFLKKWADHQLLNHEHADSHFIPHQEVFAESREVKKTRRKGPFIICVDTSGSMEGEPERIAKVLCFAVLKVAAADQRRAFLINFAQGISVLDLDEIGQSLDALLAFLGMSFRGGTDISLALHEALHRLETDQYREADVLVISDFIMYRVSDDLTRRMQSQQRNKDTRFHNVTISDQANPDVIALFDNHWVYDPLARDVVAANLYDSVVETVKT
jgi:uncharacterized protein with von Willebrand factor type A (vWA) domain